MMKVLEKELKKEDKEKEVTMDQVYSNVRDNILKTEIDRAIEGINCFKSQEEISERELRKILN